MAGVERSSPGPSAFPPPHREGRRGGGRLLPERVVLVWREAARKQERHPGESSEQVVRRFWDRTDRTILERLLARYASVRFTKEKE